jgi:hypothetical protein
MIVFVLTFSLNRTSFFLSFRFVATLALQNNTGLDAAMTYTQDVQHFKSTQPQNSKLTNQIFDHLPKIRSSRYYGLERLVQLLSATTLTMRRSVEHILNDSYSNLLFMEYEEYELKVRYPTQDVFVQFEDRFQQFKEFFLEQGRRRGRHVSGFCLIQYIVESYSCSCCSKRVSGPINCHRTTSCRTLANQVCICPKPPNSPKSSPKSS